jgi:hypothetical protein
MRIARALACLAVAAGAVSVAPPSAGAATAPVATTSRYMKTTDTTVLYNEGCAAGRASQTGYVVLDFGQPAYVGGSYGTYIFNNTFRSTSQIEAAAKSFAKGYWNCSSSTPWVIVSVGTTNYHNATGWSHGKAWAAMVSDFGSWVNASGYGSQVAVAGASDLELDWNTPATTRAWVNGFIAAGTGASYLNYGDAAGCPPYGSCNNGWTQEDVYYVSWGASPAWPLPEIYTTNGSMASEWYRMVLYGSTAHGSRMAIMAPMTQYQACLDNGGCNNGTNNTPSQAWNQLMSKLNADSRTSQQVPYTTDITWKN